MKHTMATALEGISLQTSGRGGSNQARQAFESETALGKHAGLTREEKRSGGRELVVPVTDAAEMEPAMGDAIAIAKSFSAGVALVFVMRRQGIPEGYAKYAALERIRDFPSRYIESVTERELGPLKAEVERAGLECRAFAFEGSMSEAIRSSGDGGRTVAVVLRRRFTGGRRFILPTKGLDIASLRGLRVPIVLIP